MDTPEQSSMAQSQKRKGPDEKGERKEKKEKRNSSLRPSDFPRLLQNLAGGGCIEVERKDEFLQTGAHKFVVDVLEKNQRVFGWLFTLVDSKKRKITIRRSGSASRSFFIDFSKAQKQEGLNYNHKTLGWNHLEKCGDQSYLAFNFGLKQGQETKDNSELSFIFDDCSFKFDSDSIYYSQTKTSRSDDNDFHDIFFKEMKNRFSQSFPPTPCIQLGSSIWTGLTRIQLLTKALEVIPIVKQLHLAAHHRGRFILPSNSDSYNLRLALLALVIKERKPVILVSSKETTWESQQEVVQTLYNMVGLRRYPEKLNWEKYKSLLRDGTSFLCNNEGEFKPITFITSESFYQRWGEVAAITCGFLFLTDFDVRDEPKAKIVHEMYQKHWFVVAISNRIEIPGGLDPDWRESFPDPDPEITLEVDFPEEFLKHMTD